MKINRKRVKKFMNDLRRYSECSREEIRVISKDFHTQIRRFKTATIQVNVGGEMYLGVIQPRRKIHVRYSKSGCRSYRTATE